MRDYFKEIVGREWNIIYQWYTRTTESIFQTGIKSKQALWTTEEQAECADKWDIFQSYGVIIHNREGRS